MRKAFRIFFTTLGFLLLISGFFLFFSSFTEDAVVVYWFENLPFDIMIFSLCVGGLALIVIGSILKRK